MDTTFNAPGGTRQNFRDILLSDSILKSLKELIPKYVDDISVVRQDDDTGPLTDLLHQSAFDTGPWAKRRLFVGLNGDATAHQGVNLLLCTRPLKDELRDFAKRHDLGNAPTGTWVSHVLSNFQQVLFLDRFHFGQSACFAPWIQPNLIDRFPIRLGDVTPPRPDGAGPRVLLLDHREAFDRDTPLRDLYADLAGGAEVLDLDGSEDRETLLTRLSADIHVHHGVSNHRASDISPIDSMAAGIYTVILPEFKSNGDSLLGDETFTFAAGRSYAQVADDTAKALGQAEEMVQRVETIVSSGLPFNPEIRRAKRMNDEFLGQKVNMLKGYILQ
ncbi:MAG: hypothetical protein AAFY65_11075 [Pseudomonadota bacterium]